MVSRDGNYFGPLSPHFGIARKECPVHGDVDSRVPFSGALRVSDLRWFSAIRLPFPPLHSRRSEIAGWVLQRQERSRHAPIPAGWCARVRSERHGLFAHRRVSPLPPAEGKLTRLARLLLRQRGPLARLCPVQGVPHGPACADLAAPERERRAAPETACRRRQVRRGATEAGTHAGTAATVIGDHGPVRTGTGPVGRAATPLAGSASPRPIGPTVGTSRSGAWFEASLVDEVG